MLLLFRYRSRKQFGFPKHLRAILCYSSSWEAIDEILAPLEISGRTSWSAST